MSYSSQSRSEKDLSLLLMWEDSSPTGKKHKEELSSDWPYWKKSKLPPPKKKSVTGQYQESESGAV